MSVYEEREQEAPVYTQRASSPGFSCVSMKSNNSMFQPPDLSDGPAVTFDPVGGRADQIRYVSCPSSTSSYSQNHFSHHDTEAALQLNSHQPVYDDLQRVKDQHRTSMKNKYESVFEGIKLQENQTLLNRIYTQLYIIEGESEGVNEEHEVLQMEKSYRTLQDTPINCNDIFNPLPEPGYEENRREKKDKIKTVLTKGIAGIGKTVSNGHLDLFLRFLHGISLESNQRLLQDALIHTENNPEIIKKITQNLKRGQKNYVSPERWMNLSHCLIEMKDNSVVKEMQAFLNSKTKRKKLSLAQCSTLANIILMSEEVLDEFDLKQYNIKTREGRWRLLPAVRNCRKAFLAGCNLTGQQCEIVASALQSSNSPLRELDLSNNHLQDSGGKLLAAGLKSPNCQLNILRLSGCLVKEEGCAALASALSSNLSHLRELDLSNNHLQDSGVKLLAAGLKSPNQLNILRLSYCLVTAEGCAALASALSSRKGSIQTNSEMTHGVTLIDLNRMARNIPAFTPELAGDHDVHAYLRDIDFYLQSWTSVSHHDRLYLLWITSSPEVRRFMARQPGHIQSDYQRLKQAIIKDFSDPDSEHGLIAALDTKQCRHETPHAYYHRLR
ncbi:uncharacterized protein [Sinocyclocheilus grahami]|uniref:uncharacterized protein n=1 Tax=Sinocyclocheilus grahami TaxID=75366 RepID=UPI0007AD6323|nr:PREDICTED: uncharacterized protein LOC107574200 [Sinocyclocheilus grahami]